MANIHVKEIMQQFAFSDQEVDIYVAVLSLGSPTVSEIAKRVGMSRTNAYFHIKNLREKGALQETRRGKTLYFVAKAPSELADIFSRHTDAFKSLVPLLESLQTVEAEKPRIEILESKQGYFKVYESVSFLPEGSTFRCIEGRQGIIDEFKIFSSEQWNIFFKRVVDRKLKTLGLFTKESLHIPRRDLTHETMTTIKKRNWDLRALPEATFPIQELALIYGDKVSFLFPQTSLVMTIQHKGIVDFLVCVFDALFQFAEQVDWE